MDNGHILELMTILRVPDTRDNALPKTLLMNEQMKIKFGKKLNIPLIKLFLRYISILKLI